MNASSDEDNSESDEGLMRRWAPSDFQSHNTSKDLDIAAERLCEERRRITAELQKVLQLTPQSCDAFLQRFNDAPPTPTGNTPQQESKDDSHEETSYLQIRSSPIVLQDPVPSDDEKEVHQKIRQTSCKRTFLKRGAGLARFNMTKADFKKPPELYKNKELLPQVRGEKTKSNRGQKRENNLKTVPTLKVKSLKGVGASKPLASTRPIPPQPINSIDEEVIPALRHSSSAYASWPNFEIPPKKPVVVNKPPPMKIPKKPMKELILKDTPIAKINENVVDDERENKIFEILEQRAEDSDFCSQNSSVQKLLNGSISIPGLKPKKLVFNKPPQIEDDEPEVASGNLVESNAGLLPKPELKTYTEHQIALRVKRKALEDNVKKIFECNINSRLKVPSRKLGKRVKIKKIPKSPKVEKVNLRELKSKLVELEKEKLIFQRDNYKLKRIYKELLDEKIALEKQKKEDEKRLREEFDKLNSDRVALSESQRKFFREKLAFENYCKETKNLPPREEREEIRKVKEEIEKMKVQLQTKEARWGSSQARLRNQIKSLENENKELKKELEEAKKIMVKRVTFDTQQQVNTKVINAINKELGRKLFGAKDKTGQLSAREPITTNPKILRRTKSATEIKNLEPVKVSNYGVSVNNTVPTTIKLDLDEDSDEIDEDEQEIIDTFPVKKATSFFNRSNSADSGVETRPSGSEEGTENQSSDSSLKSDGCSKNTSPCTRSLEHKTTKPMSYSAIKELKQRVRHLIRTEDTLPKFQGNSPGFWDCCGAVNDPLSIFNGCKGKDTIFEDGPINKRVLPNGDIEEIFSNGKKKLISHCGDFIRIVYPNDDIREQYLRSLREKYFYKETGIWQTTFTDRPGYQQLDMPDGRTVVYHPDGNVDTLYPNGATARLKRSGTQEWRFKTGEIVRTNAKGEKVLIFPDGRKEYTSKEYTRLEEVDGTIKTVYLDGRQETKYPNGRVRVKDKHGNVVMNTAGFSS